MFRFRFYTLFPGLAIPTYSLLAVSLYYFGPYYYPDLNLGASIYLLFCGMLAFVGFYLGAVKTRSMGKPRAPVVARDTHLILLLLFVGSAIGFLFLIGDLIRGGLGVEEALTMTSEVRKLRDRSLVSTLAVPFNFCWLPAFALFAYMVFWRVPIPWYNYLGLGVNGFLIVFNSLINVNRNPILNLLLLFLFLLIFSRRLNFSMRRVLRFLALIPILFVFVVGFLFYSIFITENRKQMKESLLVKQTIQQSRYDLGSLGMDPGTEAMIVQGGFYFSHPIVFIDAALDTAGLVFFHPTAFNGWLGRQVMRFTPELYYKNINRGYRVYLITGIPPNTWPSFVGNVMIGLGVIPTPFFILAFGYVFGQLLAIAFRAPNLPAFYGMFFCYYLTLFVHKGFEGNQFSNGLLLAIFLCVFFKRKLPPPFGIKNAK